MKQLVVMVALLLAAPALAQQRGPNDPMNVKLFGEWSVETTRDRFDDSMTVVAMLRDVLAVRCLRREASIVLSEAMAPFREGETVLVQFRVDRKPVIDTAAAVINRRVIQLVTTAPMIEQLRDGRELALRIDAQASFDRVYRLGRAKEALVPVVAACPID